MNAANQPQPEPNIKAAGTPAPKAATRRPLWRGCLTLLATAIILVAVLYVVLLLLRGTHAKPLDVKLYPFARALSQKQLDNADQAVYVTGDSIDKVTAFYIETFGKAKTALDNGCLLGQSAPNKAGAVVPIVECITDVPFLDISQTVLVKLEPSPDTPGQVVITVDRTW
jgi:hypothetical protein